MNPLDFEKVNGYIDLSIKGFYYHLSEYLKNLSLDELLSNNPYILKIHNINDVCKLIRDILDSYLSSSEEKLFGDFLEGLAIFIAEMTCGGHKSTAPGADLEFIKNDIHYVVSIKSGPNWGNSSQQDKLEQDLKTAFARVKQSRRGVNVQPVLGICYGKTKTSYLRGYMKVVGQNFWYLISEDKNLYTDIIEPIGYRAIAHNESFQVEKDKVTNRFTKQFIDRFCEEDGAIHWVKLVQFNSGNFDLDRFIP